ncbi:hypothetical protein DD576_30445, partial [Klebsiella pneumoniae]|uniref:GAG-pre-integrase domain-containing protein n=1 Tax=Klebsiella pneumoniae TaxID=573 RepID=UPI0010255D5F
MDDEGHNIAFGNKRWKISKGSLVVAKGEKVGTLYLCTVSTQPLACAATTEVDSAVWHYRLGHMSGKVMQILQTKKLLPGLKKVDL